MPIYTRWTWAVLMPMMLSPISMSLIGGILSVAVTSSVQYRMAQHQWSNEIRNIDATGRFYEFADASDERAEGISKQQASDYVKITTTTFSFKSHDPEKECAIRLAEASTPWGRSLGRGDPSSDRLQVCREHRPVIHLSGPDTLIEMVPVTLVNGQLMGARVRITTPKAPPEFFGSVTSANDLPMIALTGAFSMFTTFVMGYLARPYLTALRISASTDNLTDCLRREAFFSIADRKIRLARKFGRPLAGLAVDVDHLKQINDSLGHVAGDAALKRIAGTMHSILRSGDVLGRIGGDEFAIVLPATTANAAVKLAERIRQKIHEHNSESVEGEISVSVSIGVAELGRLDADAQTLIARADAKLYSAKASRNSVVA